MPAGSSGAVRGPVQTLGTPSRPARRVPVGAAKLALFERPLEPPEPFWPPPRTPDEARPPPSHSGRRSLQAAQRRPYSAARWELPGCLLGLHGPCRRRLFLHDDEPRRLGAALLVMG